MSTTESKTMSIFVTAQRTNHAWEKLTNRCCTDEKIPVVCSEGYGKNENSVKEWREKTDGKFVSVVNTDVHPLSLPGARIEGKIKNLFESKCMVDEAKRHNFNLSFKTGFIDRYSNCIVECRGILEDNKMSEYKEVKDNINALMDIAERLDRNTIGNMDNWSDFLVNAGMPNDWNSKINENDIWTLFGASPQLSEQLSLGFSPTPLFKFFKWYGYVFPLFNVLNLINAMTGEPTGQFTEQKIMEMVDNFKTRLIGGNFAGLWIPNLYIHNSKFDDILCLNVLKYIHTCMDTTLHVVSQFPYEIAETSHTYLARNTLFSFGSIFYDDQYTDVGMFTNYWTN
jgi:hypothetical protein